MEIYLIDLPLSMFPISYATGRRAPCSVNDLRGKRRKGKKAIIRSIGLDQSPAPLHVRLAPNYYLHDFSGGEEDHIRR